MDDSGTIVDPQDAAESVGLRYVSDGDPGITRRKAGKGFSYRGLDGRPIRDKAELARINSQIALQTQLFDLVTATSAAQIQAAERLQVAFDSFVDGLSTELTDMVMDWEFDLDGLRDVFKQLARDLFIKPVMDSFSSGIGNFIKGFAGGFATGGTLRPGQWGIAGEIGPEPIFAGARSLSVIPNDEAFGSRRGGTTIIQNISTPNADSFRYSQRQIARKAKTTLGG